jgi:steroid delta-isomerase-like uncharacterized protein
MSNHENKNLVRRWFEEGFWVDDIDKSMEAVFAPDYYLTSNGKIYNGREELKTLVGAVRAAFSDARIKVEEIIAEGDAVAWHWTFKARNTGNFMGAPSTGKSVTITATGWARVKDGKLVEAKENWDQFTMMQQMGVIPEA